MGCNVNPRLHARPWEDLDVADADLSGGNVPARHRDELISDAALEARLHQNAYDRFEDAAAAYVGVNRTAMRCMEVLDRRGQQTAGEIAAQTGLTSGAVTAMLDRLERAGLAQRLADPSDRRRVLVQMTAKARQIAAEVYGPLAEAIGEFERYTDDELLLITGFLRLATKELERHAERVERQAGQRGRGS
jgi:DNA-binding MarR family transcriptional regulator